MTETRLRRTVARLTLTLTQQSWLFMIGASLFALGSAPGISSVAGAHATNLMFFVGAWFFTSAGFIQWVLSRRDAIRADRIAATVQSVGTLLFNVSTGAALYATSLAAEERFVWRPDAAGSVAFLVSAVFVLSALPRGRRLWDPLHTSWWSALINMLGCIAFGVSAVGAYITTDGSDADLALANGGTFAGAICFFLASLVVLPQLPWNRSRYSESSV